MVNSKNFNKNLAEKRHTQISKIITTLMCEVGIREAELARQTGLPQTTINRLLLGETTDPRASTLKPIAKFFGVTIGQILGEEPLQLGRISGTFMAHNRAAWVNVPIIPWEEAIAWVFKKDTYHMHANIKWIVTERAVSNISFAIISKPFMEPRFKKDSILIVDPNTLKEDGKYVVVTLDSSNVTVRKLIYEQNAIYLTHFDATLPSVQFNSDYHNILGTIVESRLNF